MVSILGADGQPIRTADISEPQTSRLGQLQREFQGHPSRGLTPSRLAQYLEAAEQGDLLAQYELFEDMEEKDGHIASDMGKRRRAVSGLDWDVTPPSNPTAQEKDAAKKLKEALGEIPDFDEMLFDVTDAIGKGFAALEIEWHRLDGVWLPKSITHRPQTWFKLYRGYRQEIRLRDNSVDGTPLQPFGWITHTHKCKSGYLERSGLFRVLVWPYLFKNYSVADLAEWLEIYGIPLRLGKYPSGAGEKEKATLLRALVGVGHNAAGIMPSGMEVDFHDAATGDAKAFELMIDWCERTQSKVILGATLTSQADRGSNTNALGNVHNDVRIDLRDSDAKQLAATLTRDLLYPMAALNGWANGIRRSPRLLFDIAEPEDIQTFGGALPGLVKLGMRIGRKWAQEKIGVPEPEADEEVLGDTSTPDDDAIGTPPGKPAPVPAKKAPAANDDEAARAAATATRARSVEPSDRIAVRLAREVEPTMQVWFDRLQAAVEESPSFEALSARLLSEFTTLPTDQLNDLVAQALITAELGARSQVLDEARSAGAD